MTLTVETVAAASNAWVWSPDNAMVVETGEFKIALLPDYFDHRLAVLAFRPAGPLGDAVDAVLERARAFGLPELHWEVRLDAPAGLAAELAFRGGITETALDVLAMDLRSGPPTLPASAVDVTVRWATDFATARDGSAVQVAGFGGGALPPDDRIRASAARDAATVPAGKGGMVVAYVVGSAAGDGKTAGIGTAAGAGGVTIVDGVARLWGGAVVASARGQGVYRAVLAARLSYAVAHGATMALVKGKTDTSGPILRRAGFAAFGQEPVYRIPL